MKPKFEVGQKVWIKSPLARIKIGVIKEVAQGKLELSTIQKFQHPESVFIYFVSCGLQGFIHGYYESELEPRNQG